MMTVEELDDGQSTRYVNVEENTFWWIKEHEPGVLDRPQETIGDIDGMPDPGELFSDGAGNLMTAYLATLVIQVE